MLLASNLSGRLICFHGVPEITTYLLFAFQDFAEFLKNIEQLVGIPCFECALHNSLQFLLAPSAIRHFLRKFGFCREYCGYRTGHLNHQTEGRLHFFVLIVALPRLTARKAATIEPTIQVPISAVRAVKDSAPNNSTILSSVRTTSISSGACLKQ
jgi:hypothetical protein